MLPGEGSDKCFTRVVYQTSLNNSYMPVGTKRNWWEGGQGVGIEQKQKSNRKAFEKIK